jgi:hypothetical protein
MTFEIDPKSRRQLARWMVAAPKKVRGAAGMFLNELAFQTRVEAIRFWKVDQTTRNRSFVKGRIKFQKTRLGIPIHMQQSSTFSLSKDRFSGWSEQEYGTKTKRKRVATRKGRAGSFKRQIKKRARFRKRFYSPRDLGSSSAYIQNAHHAAQVMLIWARRNLPDNEPFLLFGHRRIQPGIFEFDSKELVRLQYLDSPKAQPRKIKWMSISMRRMYAKNATSLIWKKVIDKQKAFQ